MTLTDCTISGNSAGSGGGIYNGPGTTTLTGTIVAGNSDQSGPNDIGGSSAAAVSGSFSLIGTGGSGGIVNGSHGNIVLTSLTNLGLAPLGDNGGPTETMALLPGSVAIHNGTNVSGVTSDQRHESLDVPPDIGAYQLALHLLQLRHQRRRPLQPRHRLPRRPDTHSNPDTNSYTDTNSNADTDADTHSNTDTDTDTNADANSDDDHRRAGSFRPQD